MSNIFMDVWICVSQESIVKGHELTKSSFFDARQDKLHRQSGVVAIWKGHFNPFYRSDRDRYQIYYTLPETQHLAVDDLDGLNTIVSNFRMAYVQLLCRFSGG